MYYRFLIQFSLLTQAFFSVSALKFISKQICRDEKSSFGFAGRMKCHSGYILENDYIETTLDISDDVCLRKIEQRTEMKSLTTVCLPNEDKIGKNCYEQCAKGYEYKYDSGNYYCKLKTCGPDPAFKESNLKSTCIKPSSYGRGVGFPWQAHDALDDKGMFNRCEQQHGKGNCEKSGLVVYPKCKQGFHAVGCCVCSPNCPRGATDAGHLCLKGSHSRVFRKRLACEQSQERVGDVCFDKCREDSVKVELKCVNKCSNISKPFECGVFCTSDSLSCKKLNQQLALYSLSELTEKKGLSDEWSFIEKNGDVSFLKNGRHYLINNDLSCNSKIKYDDDDDE